MSSRRTNPMRLSDAERTLERWDRAGRYVWTSGDLAGAFPEDSPRAVKDALARLVRAGLARRVVRGVYRSVASTTFDGLFIEHVVAALRPGELSYRSLESALSDYGAISQVPFRHSFVTTGRSAVFELGGGELELVHTARGREPLMSRTVETAHPSVRLATLDAAHEDLVRVGRNLHLVDMDEARELQAFQRGALGHVA